jgi:hypothetical protein
MYATKRSKTKRWVWVAVSALAGAGVMVVGPQARWHTIDPTRFSK